MSKLPDDQLLQDFEEMLKDAELYSAAYASPSASWDLWDEILKKEEDLEDMKTGSYRTYPFGTKSSEYSQKAQCEKEGHIVVRSYVLTVGKKEEFWYCRNCKKEVAE